MALSIEEYACINDFSVLYSGGLDSCAVPLVIGTHTKGGIHLLTYKHSYGTFFNEWSKKHTPELQRDRAVAIAAVRAAPFFRAVEINHISKFLKSIFT